ncbi:hypothetical protein Q0Z83_015200 [Actinoplanes sichuanensis]|uniref:Uncharacterized protein n=1 Tax=Actinoplanes sichuanensis TaxID=512349 RepID=A0ABW4A7N5_9ACTN|nr:hypothetical protein [Actinoplanes sichuanensis]BEL03329.1 hypothetical protein Q0Z83_015200 [Actinoplanes sichuanensis]
MIDNTGSLSWVARIGNEGGPLLICAAETFDDWTGAVFDAEWQLDPACDLARAEAVLSPDDDEEEAGLLRFGPDGRHSGLVWQMDGGGVAEIATTGDGLLIMRSWVGREHEGPRRHVTTPGARIGEVDDGEIDLPTGRVAVVWAAAPAAEVVRSSPDQLDLPELLNIGALTSVPPGRYRIGHGHHDGADGRYAPAGPPVGGDHSCRWIRLERSA